MSFFELSGPFTPASYPFDYHSHLGGILPVRAAKGGYSLANWLDEDDPEHGEFMLFEAALKFMKEANPFTPLIGQGNAAAYQRGECVAENIYIASVLLAQRTHPADSIDALPVTDPRLYETALEAIRPALGKDRGKRGPLLEFVRYFNGKIYSSNKYTPFDDVYKARSSLVDRIGGVKEQRGERYDAWLVATLEYLYGQGIRAIHIAAGVDDIPLLDKCVQGFNKDKGTSYRALAHTAAGYLSEEALKKDLDKIFDLLKKNEDPESKKYPATVGLDLLGTENKVADYQGLFRFLLEKKTELAKNFGKDDNARAPRMAVHIHNGEGNGSGPDNRSLIGYQLLYGSQLPDADFYPALSAYIGRCAQATGLRQALEGRGVLGARGRKSNGVSGLFDELFRHNALTYHGCQLRRFDINDEHSGALVAYNAKRSVMALSEALDAPIDTSGNAKSWYATLTAEGFPYAFRLGHDYYYRNYMAARYPALAFDTNLGSNAITGAAGWFGSVESYRINRGLRHLDGYIETDTLDAAATAVAYMAGGALDAEQIAFFLGLSKRGGSLDDQLKQAGTIEELGPMLKKALGPVAGDMEDGNDYYQLYRKLAVVIVGPNDMGPFRYQALTRVYMLFLNWRSYLLGADGQGVEHTNIQDEFLRMLILLAYNLLPLPADEKNKDSLNSTLQLLQDLLLKIAAIYWQTTMGGLRIAGEKNRGSGVTSLQGFKSPASVITLRRLSSKL